MVQRLPVARFHCTHQYTLVVSGEATATLPRQCLPAESQVVSAAPQLPGLQHISEPATPHAPAATAGLAQ